MTYPQNWTSSITTTIYIYKLLKLIQQRSFFIFKALNH